MATTHGVAATRSKPDKEFHRTISSLNEDYGLGIASSAHQASSVASGQAQTRDIYERLYALHSTGHAKTLSRLLGRFALEAQEVSRQWVSRPQSELDLLPEISRPAPLGAQSDTERAALLRCLRDLLDTMPPRPTKRHSSDSGGPTSKIRVTRSDFDDIDAIPVLSTPSKSHSKCQEDFSPRPRAQLPRRANNNTSFTYSSANTSKISLISSVLSGPGSQETAASSQSTRYTPTKSRPGPPSRCLDDDFPEIDFRDKGLGENNPSCREQTLKTLGAMPVAKHKAIGPMHFDSEAAEAETSDVNQLEDLNRDTSPVREAFPANELRWSQSTFGGSADHFSYEDWDILSPEPPRDSEYNDTEGDMTESLRKIWPNPPPNLNHAPLAVIWEVTRAAIHCKVNPSSFHLTYEDNSGWRNLDMLRNKISTHELFIGKGLPERCDDATWDAALNGFWHHDKVVVLAAELFHCEAEDGPPFQLHLKPMKLELGHRLDRRFGADRFLEITMPSPKSLEKRPGSLNMAQTSSDQFFKWLCREVHHFVGRCWKPFFSKPVTKKVKATSTFEKKETTQFLDQVYFCASDGDHFRNPKVEGQLPLPGEARTLDRRTKLSYDKLLEWAINPKGSGEQPALKLFSRIALSLTRAYASVVLEPFQIRHIEDDIMSDPDPDQNGKRMEMNDGMGKMSWGLCKKIAEELELGYIPSAFQGRLGSAKGMWIRDVESPEVDNDIWIETYPSQRKWVCDFVDIHHRSFEVRSYSKELRPASLNQQFIPILEARAVADHKKKAMRARLGSHLSNSLESDLKMHLDAMNHPAETLLFVKQMRASFTATTPEGSTRFLGGIPNKDEDLAAFLLDSGFEVRHSKLLADTMWNMWQEMTQKVKDKWSFEVPCSTNAYMAVDFSGVLKPGEVHLSFSSAFTVDGFSDTQLEDMDILVARSPAHFPSDIQKVRVVSRSKLRKLKDVIVFPSTGSRPLADLLSGGDYDGDRAWICWDRDIVDNFSNADPSPEYNFVAEGYLRKHGQTFNGLLNTYFDNFRLACEEFHILGMSFNMQPSLLGRCTKYKEKLTYFTSVDHEAVLLLSILLGNLVDQAKAGIEFTDDDWKRFRKTRLKVGAFEDPEYSKEYSSDWIKRSPPHILDYLKFEVANRCVEELSTQLGAALSEAQKQRADPDLTKLYMDYFERSKESGRPGRPGTIKQLMAHLNKELVKLSTEWPKGVGANDYEARVQDFHAKWVQISPPEDLKEELTVRDLKDDWATGGQWTAPFSQWSYLKASTTFYKFHGSNYKLAWLLAGKQLAKMKSTILANSLSQTYTSAIFVQPTLWTVRKPDKRLIERMWKRRAAVGGDKTAALDDVTELDEDGTVIDD